MSGKAIKSFLLRAKDLADTELKTLESSLSKEKLLTLKAIAKDLRIRLTGATRKQDVVNRQLCMARIGAIRDSREGKDGSDGELCSISYLTDDTKKVIRELPPFTTVTTWSKKLLGVLTEFTFMNLLIYLVYGRDKTFDMESMKAFRSLKAFKYFFDGFVRNAWVYECPMTNNLNLKILYFRAFVHHSLTCDTPLEVYCMCPSMLKMVMCILANVPVCLGEQVCMIQNTCDYTYRSFILPTPMQARRNIGGYFAKYYICLSHHGAKLWSNPLVSLHGGYVGQNINCRCIIM